MRLADCLAPAEVVRDGEFAGLGFVTHRGHGLLVFAEDSKFLPALAANPGITAVLAAPHLVHLIPEHLGVAQTAQPRRSFYELHNRLARTEFYASQRPNAIAADARIHGRAIIAENNVTIGPRCIVEANAVICAGATLGAGVIVRAGAVIGGEGFQFVAFGDELLPVAHAGGVRLDDGVEVQHNTCIDRAVFGGETWVGAHSKIDNLVHIAHNVRTGQRCRIVAGAMVAGSVVLGDDVWVGPQAAISSEVVIGDGAFVSLGAVVTRDVAAGQRVTGNFAIEHGRFLDNLRRSR